MDNIRTKLILVLSILAWSLHVIVAQTSTVTNKNVNRTPDNVETVQLKSKIFDNTRTIRVLLPPGYHEPKSVNKSYPVLYLTDGIMAFRKLNLQETVGRLVCAGSIPPIIVVGIDNGASTDKPKNPDTDRENEFLPYPDVGFPPNHLYEPNPPSPIGKLYPKFLIREVMPLIKKTYRIKTGKANTGIGGFSYGGVAALYSVISNPNLFDMMLLESTPLWIGKDKQLLNDAHNVTRWPKFVSIGVGTNESPDDAINNEGKRDIELLEDLIRASSHATIIKSVLKEGAKHEPSAWKERLPDALVFLFKNKGDRNVSN